MTHNEQNVEQHHEGDAAELHITVEDETGNAMDLTGSQVEWLLMENEADADADALLTKDGTEGGTTNGVEFTDPVNGQVKVIIDTGDTESLVTWSNYPSNSREYHHRVRVTDTNSNRITGFTGTFEVLP